MSAVLPHLEITPQRPDWLAGHVGFELRCAERKFISLSIRQDSDSREPTQTVLSFRRIIFWYHIGVRILSRGLIGFEPQRDIRNSSIADLRSSTGETIALPDCRDVMMVSPPISYDPGMIGGVKTSTMIAHFPLDIPCERSVSGDQCCGRK